MIYILYKIFISLLLSELKIFFFNEYYETLILNHSLINFLCLVPDLSLSACLIPIIIK